MQAPRNGRARRPQLLSDFLATRPLAVEQENFANERARGREQRKGLLAIREQRE